MSLQLNYSIIFRIFIIAQAVCIIKTLKSEKKSVDNLIVKMKSGFLKTSVFS